MNYAVTCPYCPWSTPTAGPGDPFGALVRELHLNRVHPDQHPGADPDLWATDHPLDEGEQM